MRIWRSGGLPQRWSVEFKFDNGVMISVNEVSVAQHAIRGADQNDLLWQLPLPRAQILAAVTATEGLHAEVRGGRAPVGPPLPEQMIPGHRKMDRFDDDVDPHDRLRALGFGRLDLMSADSNALIATCTAFRIALRFWLTAGHCVANDESHDNKAIGAWWIHPANYEDGKKDHVPAFRGEPVGSGQEAGLADPSRWLGDNDLDYAVLLAHEDPGGPSFPIEAHSEESVGAPVKLYLDSVLSETRGKARSQDQCRLVALGSVADRGPKAECPGQIQHNCSGDEGSSGSPLLLADSIKLVGLHYGYGSPNLTNCALRMSAVRQHFCTYHREIATGIMPCD